MITSNNSSNFSLNKSNGSTGALDFPLLRLTNDTDELGFGLPASRPTSAYYPKTTTTTTSKPKTAGSCYASTAARKLYSSHGPRQPSLSSDDDDDDDDFDMISPGFQQQANDYNNKCSGSISGMTSTGVTGAPDGLTSIGGKSNMAFDSLRQEKVASLGKRVKSLTIALEKEKSQKADLLKRVQELEMTMMEMNQQNNCNNGGAEVDEVKAIKEKMKQLARKLEQEQVKCQAYKRDLQIAQKIIKAEIGPSVTSLADIQKLADSNSWRGRAQQISLLKDRIKELESQLQAHSISTNQSLTNFSSQQQQQQFRRSSSSNTNTHESSRSALNKLRTELDAVSLECQQHQSDIMKLKVKYGASKAKIRAHELQNGELKQQLQIVLEKTALDDQMISKLKRQLQRSVGQSNHSRLHVINQPQSVDIQHTQQPHQSQQEQQQPQYPDTMSSSSFE